MGNPFQSVSVKKPQYSYFDLSHDHKLTCNMGQLVPILVQECLPSDRFHISSEAMIRLQPMVAPIMHKVDIYIHHFFVPNRLIWKNWESFITGDNRSITLGTPNAPVMGPGFDVQSGHLADYMGLPIAPPAAYDPEPVSALPFAAYQRIWFDYYRDQNLQNLGGLNFEEYFGLQDAQQPTDQTNRLKVIRYRAWEHDYFTSCLPFAQKGAEVILPIEATVDIELLNQNVHLQSDGATYQRLVELDGDPFLTTGNLEVDGRFEGPGGVPLNMDPNGTLKADVVGTADLGVVTTSINDLRAAYQLQKWLEKNARGGTRYTESLLVHFGVRSSDARLQRPEYIGGSKSIVAISEVLQTSQSDVAGTAQGNMAGHGISMVGGRGSSYFCEEHGFIISILSVRPKTAYHQGLPRMWTRFDRLQYAWSEFAMLGEEAVKMKELYFQTTPVNTNEDTFGYLPRYSEYRYNPSRVSGDFHNTLDYWAMHRTFDAIPYLDDQFIECHPTSRIFAIEDPAVHHLIGHVYHSITARRPLPKYGDPGGLI